MKLQGKKGITLSENQVAVYSDYAESVSDLKKALLKFIDLKDSIAISGKIYNVYPDLITNSVVTSPSSDLMLALVVPDKLADGSQIHQTMVSLNCRKSSINITKKLESDIYTFAEKYKKEKDLIKISAATKSIIKSIAAGSKAMISFIGIYLGIIFLITSAATLALQQLSETADNRNRYKILQKIGTDDSVMNAALFKQIAIYFMLPLALAVVHSIIGIKVANEALDSVGEINAASNIIITAVLIILIYGSYFLATYSSSKRIILKDRI
jgi:putative ABC transport system permease protein